LAVSITDNSLLAMMLTRLSVLQFPLRRLPQGDEQIKVVGGSIQHRGHRVALEQQPVASRENDRGVAF
jgi:hypothetical protein